MMIKRTLKGLIMICIIILVAINLCVCVCVCVNVSVSACVCFTTFITLSSYVATYILKAIVGVKYIPNCSRYFVYNLNF